MSIHILWYTILLGIYLSVVGVMAVIAAELHERSHWSMARVWTREVSIDRWRGIIAKRVNFHEPYDIPPYGIRISGFAPPLFGFLPGVMIFWILTAPIGIRLIIALPFWASMFLSPVDLLAIFYPRCFQEYIRNGEAVGHIGMIQILIQRTRETKC